MTVKPPTPPPLPDELDRLLRRLRLPYVRRAAPEVIATATAQRWEHAEVLRVLLAEEAAGRDQATIRMRRRASGLPAGKTFDAWEPDRSAIPKPDPAGAADPRVDRPRRGPGRVRPERNRQEPLRRGARAPRDRQRQDRRLAHARDARATAPPPPRRRQRQQSDRQADPLPTSIVIDDVGLLPVSADAAEALFRVDRRRLRETLDRDQLQHPPLRVRRADAQDASPPRPSTGSCTTPTCSSPTARTATGSRKRPPARG